MRVKHPPGAAAEWDKNQAALGNAVKRT
jgi:hypothetical protein